MIDEQRKCALDCTVHAAHMTVRYTVYAAAARVAFRAAVLVAVGATWSSDPFTSGSGGEGGGTCDGEGGGSDRTESGGCEVGRNANGARVAAKEAATASARAAAAARAARQLEAARADVVRAAATSAAASVGASVAASAAVREAVTPATTAAATAAATAADGDGGEATA